MCLHLFVVLASNDVASNGLCCTAERLANRFDKKSLFSSQSWLSMMELKAVNILVM